MEPIQNIPTNPMPPQQINPVSVPPTPQRTGSRKPGIFIIIIVIIALAAIIYVYKPAFITNMISHKPTTTSAITSFANDKTGQQAFQTASAIYKTAPDFTLLYLASINSAVTINHSSVLYNMSANMSLSKYGNLSRVYVSMPLSKLYSILGMVSSGLNGTGITLNNGITSSNLSSISGTVYLLIFTNSSGSVTCTNFPFYSFLSHGGSITPGVSLCSYTKHPINGSLSALTTNNSYTSTFGSLSANQKNDTIVFLGNKPYDGSSCSLVRATLSSNSTAPSSKGHGQAYLCFSQTLGLPLFFNGSFSNSSETFDMVVSSTLESAPSLADMTRLPQNATFNVSSVLG